MNIDNPFESGQIKKYILLYASVVVIMILFFIASSLFMDISIVKKKNFETKEKNSKTLPTEIKKSDVFTPKFKLLDKGLYTSQ